MTKQNVDVKTPKNKNKIEYDDTQIETKILGLLGSFGFMRVNPFIDRARRAVGKSKATILRTLDDLEKRGEIIRLGHREFKRYGIDDADEKAKYVGLMQYGELKVHMDNIFNILEKSKNIDELKSSVSELRDYSFSGTPYRLEREQLEILIDKLAINDNELRYGLLDLIFSNIYSRRVRPINKERLLSTLRKLLQQYPADSFKQPFNPKPTIIYLLGMYKDRAVIDALKSDAEINNHEVLNSAQPMYGLKFTANLIEDNRTELFNFEIELRKQGKAAAVTFLNEVRRKARDEVNFLKQVHDPNLILK